MKNLKYLVIAFLMLFCLVGCGEVDNPDNPDDKKDDKPITINCDLSDEITITAGLKQSFNCSIVNGDGQEIIEYTSSDENVFVIKNNEIEAKKNGSATLTISLKDKNVSKQIKVNVVNPTFNITFNGDYTYSLNENTTYELAYEADKNVVSSLGFEFSSSNETVATINSKGEIRTLTEGKSTITVMSKYDNSYKFTVEINVELDPLAILASYNIENPLYQNVTTYGSTQINQMVKGSVNYYTPMALNLVENIIPITSNSPYVGMTATEELLAKAEGDNKYMRTGILHTETTKITYHDTGNNSKGANALMHANYLVGTYNQSNRARSWHYTVDEKEAIHHIPDNEVTWQGDNYYAYSTSIGIETCVDEGSELDITWHRTAKLMASLIDKYNMQISDVTQHYTWSGKNCPQTLRMNDLYSYAIKMIEAELTAITTLKDYTITFTSLNPELVDDNGHIIAIPEKATEVAYVVTATKEGVSKSKVLYTTIPGQDGSKKDTTNNTKLHEFYDMFSNISKDTYKDILVKYDTLSINDKNRASGLSFLLDQVSALFEGTKAKLTIEQVYFGNEMRYQFIKIKNNGSTKISLQNYTVKYSDGNGNSQEFGFPQKSLEAGNSYLINCAINESVDPDEVIYPDFAFDLDLSKLGTLEIYSGEVLIDKITYTTSSIRTGYSSNMENDLTQVFVTPTNSKGDYYEEIENVTSDVIDFETYALAITLPLTKDQASKIKDAMDFYNTLTTIDKSKVKSYSYLKSLKTKCDGLK